ncbi:hypothetical protein CALVIDRAFT_250986 [Calocera viscosa TUFC12733]|uniref:BZIP domain-containing protein n=1 Tax=Calocera viscosa (strain TUFC12733) TaxID=1330018 RepID=A0A167JEY5_CALVF|nr:hypothetical protein CALVIDRAFT_250986 [Calocera viscosa TUFC12733]
MSTYALPTTITFSRSLPSPPSPHSSSPPLSQSPNSAHSSPSSHQPQSGMIGTGSARASRLPAPKPMTAAERKRKNADAQAAFRQRRNEYIKKLEAAVEDRETVIKSLKDEKVVMARDNQGLRDENTRLQGKIEVLQATMKENDKLVKMLEKQLQAAQTQQQQQAHAQQQSSQSLGYEYGGLYAAPTGIMYTNQAPNSTFSGLSGMTMPIHNMTSDFASAVSAPSGPAPPRGPHHISASTFGTPTTGMRITTIAPNVAEQAQASQASSFHAYTDSGSHYDANNTSTGTGMSDASTEPNSAGTGMTNSPIESSATIQNMQNGSDGMSAQSNGSNQYTYTQAQQHQQPQTQTMPYPGSDYPYTHSAYQQQPQRMSSEHQDIKPPTPAMPFRSAQAINNLSMDIDDGMSGETVAVLKGQVFGSRRRRNLSGYDGSSSAAALDVRKRPRHEHQYEEEDA